MANSWKEYQEEAASFFRLLGLEASTDVTVKGVRTGHDVDVLVKSYHVGFQITWLVECKHWKTPISKLHVLALREIVSDVGADRGIILAEVGFQSGAIEAANLTNVQVTSLQELSVSSRNDVLSMRLRELFDRLEECSVRYWDIPKADRIEHNLRPDLGSRGFSGAMVIDLCRDLLSRALRGRYPINSETTGAVVLGITQEFNSASDVFALIEPMIVELDGRLKICEEGQRNRS